MIIARSSWFSITKSYHFFKIFDLSCAVNFDQLLNATSAASIALAVSFFPKFGNSEIKFPVAGLKTLSIFSDPTQEPLT